MTDNQEPREHEARDHEPRQEAPAADSAPHTAAAPGTAQTVRFERPIKNTVPLGTLVFGLIVLAIGLLMLGQLYLDVVVNPAIVTVSILIGAGLIMVVGGIAAARKGSTTDHTQTKG